MFKDKRIKYLQLKIKQLKAINNNYDSLYTENVKELIETKNKLYDIKDEAIENLNRIAELEQEIKELQKEIDRLKHDKNMLN